MREYAEIQEIMNAEQPEIDLVWENAENALLNQFLMEANEYGVSRWEAMLQISPKDTDTLDDRRFRILTKLNQQLPYTHRRLEQFLTTICGAEGFTIVLNPAEYSIEIRLAVGYHGALAEVEKLLKMMLPANLIQNIKLMYNPHELFEPYTHGQLSAYTHDQLRKEVFNNG